ncbi:MAG TPA: ThuA domain-containing protein [Burkholderiales bacterium]|nr:ThuA domain-containing protein [Burkholderiales bacterium]
MPGMRCIAILALALAGSAAQAQDHAVLVFSKTAGYRHASIEAAVAAVRALGDQDGFRVEATEDAAVFADDRLREYRAVVFLSTSGEVLDAGQQAAFERFIRRGGGFVGIHAATDTGYEWPWYGALVGGYFKRHPVIQPAVLTVVDAAHPSTRPLPIRWKRTDEWYDFRGDLAPDVTVLMRIDETTYCGGRMGAMHPMAWHHEYDGGRAWYTALGHTIESWQEPLFLDHVRGGIAWAAGIKN